MGKNKSSTGFTLVEMIVISSIFLILMVVVYSVFLFQQRAYSSGENSAEIIQNGRVILERITRELRQAKKIINTLPASEIKFQDGHLAIINETSNSQGGTANTITLALFASPVNNYYKDLYIKIISGTGAGQARKIFSYDGISKVAVIDGTWQETPDISSVYLLDSRFYYIYYYRNASNQVLRKAYTCCPSLDGALCAQPESYVNCTSVPSPGYQNIEVVLEEEKVIGEYVVSLDFSGTPTVSVSLGLQKNDRTFNLVNKIFGRNL